VHEVIVELGYKVSVADKCVFTCIDANDYLIIVAVYVDNFLFISKSLKFIKASKLEISGYFEIKNLGPVKWIFQMELKHAMVWTHPDIAHAVGMVSRYTATPRQAHMTTVKRIFLYLRGTSDYKPTY